VITSFLSSTGREGGVDKLIQLVGCSATVRWARQRDGRDSEVGVGVALYIVRIGFYSQNYVFLMAAAIWLTVPLSQCPATVSGGGAGAVSQEGGRVPIYMLFYEHMYMQSSYCYRN